MVQLRENRQSGNRISEQACEIDSLSATDVKLRDRWISRFASFSSQRANVYLSSARTVLDVAFTRAPIVYGSYVGSF